MKILICGSRWWGDPRPIERELKRFNPAEDVIIHGDCRGADRMGAMMARKLGWPNERIMAFPANWDLYGKAAGPIRNRQMLDENPDIVLAFHQDISKSKGTKDMVTIAQRKGTTTEVHNA